MQIFFVLKDTIKKDARYRLEESRIGDSAFSYSRFGNHHLSDGKDGCLKCYTETDDFMIVNIPQGLADYVASVEADDTFNCLHARLQGQYRLEEAGGTAEAYLRRICEEEADGASDDDFEDRRDPYGSDLDRVTNISYHVAIRASSPATAINLYRAIRAGKARPVEDWDAPMVDKP